MKKVYTFYKGKPPYREYEKIMCCKDCTDDILREHIIKKPLRIWN